MATEELDRRARAREDESSDDLFYSEPRMVAHIDDAAIAQVTAIYRALLTPLAPQGRVLDLMSSRYSHLPTDLPLAEVVGLGMNADELAENPHLTSSVVHNLNIDPRLPFDDESFDAVLNTVSVQYLTQPLAVFRDLARILKPGAPYAVIFSNRMFPTKAVLAWRERDDQGHIALVRDYFAASGLYGEPEVIVHPGKQGFWFGGGADPIYAVIARRL
ncbi:MAG: methyltransferase domain-containing protein [Ktedonobacterales bacterium]